MSKTHEEYMQVCIQLGQEALAQGNPPVGSVLVHEGQIIGQGIESGKTTNDITNHAEVLAIRDAIAQGHKALLKNTSLYSTHEPCLMCSYVIRHHKIKQIIYGTEVAHIGGHTSHFNVLSTEEVPQWGPKPIIQVGVCKKECQRLSEEFSKQLS